MRLHRLVIATGIAFVLVLAGGMSQASATPLPANYFPDDDPSRRPQNRWRSHAHLLFSNWINEIYQTTPFDVAQIGADR